MTGDYGANHPAAQPLLPKPPVPFNWGHSELAGLCLMALSPVGSAIQALLVRVGHRHWTTSEMLLNRGLIQTLITLLIYRCVPPSEVKENGGLLGPPDQRYWLVIRGLAGCTGIVFLYMALELLPLGEATGPIFTALLASVWLHEPYGLFEIGSALTSFVGVALLSGSRAEPTTTTPITSFSHSERLIGTLAALSAAMFSAISYVTIRKIGRHANFVVSVLYFAVMCSAMGAVGVYVEERTGGVLVSGWRDIAILLGIGVSGFLGQTLLTLGLQMSQAGRAVIMRYVEVPLAFGFGLLVLDEIPTVRAIIGSSLILVSALSLALRAWIFRH